MGQSVSARVVQKSGFQHAVEMGNHTLLVDEPVEFGGQDLGPTPQQLLAASLASCTAITMQMYAQRKEWDVGNIGVEVNYKTAERGCPTRFEIVLTFADSLTDEQVQRLKVIATKCPVHRILDGEVMFDERVERTAHSS